MAGGCCARGAISRGKFGLVAQKPAIHWRAEWQGGGLERTGSFRGQSMSACAEPRPLQIERNDLLFEEGFKFVHLLMDRLITQTRPYRHCQNYLAFLPAVPHQCLVSFGVINPWSLLQVQHPPLYT